MRSRFRLSLVAVALLVLLRISIGWHFLYEGLWKRNQPEFSSAGFWQQSKGPFSDIFLDLVPDRLGYERLDADATGKRWDAYLATANQHYNFGAEQKEQATKLLQSCKAQLAEFLAENREAIETYFHELKRLDAARSDPRLKDVPFQQKRIWQEQQRLSGEAAPWLARVDTIDAAYKDGLQSLPSDKDQKLLPPPPEPTTRLAMLDRIVVPFTIAVGLCLVVGLFTRTAAIAGAFFLMTIVASQPEWPTIFPPAPPSSGHALLVNKEFIEMVALFALAATAVGRWGGLDFFIHYLLVAPWASRRKRDVSVA